MKKLLMLVGLPRSGKTTWAAAERFPTVSPDAIRLALHGHHYIHKTEPHVWAIAHTMVHALFLAGHDTVVLDVCNNTRKRRDEWKSSSWQRVFHVMETTAAVCTWRAIDDGRQDLIPSIERMVEQHEPVTQEERDAG